MTLLLLKITLLLSFGALTPWALQKASAATRHLVIVTVLAASLLVPVLSVILPAWEILPSFADLASRPNSSATAVAVPDRSASALTKKTAPPASIAAQTHASPSLRQSVSLAWNRMDRPQTLAVGWAVGASLALLLLTARLIDIHLRSLRSASTIDASWLELVRSIKTQLGIRTSVSLRLTEPGAMPMVWGFRSYVVFLPQEAHAWSAERLRAVLTHELGHVARRDPLSILLGHLACSIHWFHPLAWVLTRRLTIERELACDNLVLGQGVAPRSYAQHLLSIAAGNGRATHSVAPVMAAPSQLEERIVAILDNNRNRNTSSFAMRAAIAALGIAAAVPMTSLAWARPTSPQDSGRSAPTANRGTLPAPGTAGYLDSDVARFQTKLDPINYGASDVDRLLEGLRAGDEMTSAASAWALGKTEDPRAVTPLIRALDNRFPKTREWAARSLGALGDPRAVDPLIVGLEDRDEVVREWSARSLAAIGDPVAIDALMRAVDDPNAVVRQWIVRALGEFRDERTIPTLLECLEDSSPVVQEWAVRALGMFYQSPPWGSWNPGQPTPKPGEPVLVSSLIDLLGSDDADVREWSARTLGNIGDESAVEPLTELVSDDNAEVSEWASRALESLQDSKATAP